MADVSHFNIKIAVDSKSGQAEVVKFGKVGKESMDGLEKSAKKAQGSMMSFSTLLKGAGIAALGAFAAKAVKGAADLENYATQFEVLTGSAEKGADLFKQIREFGAATPFETKDLAAATQTMLGFNIAQEQVMGNLQMLGDISGGNAERLQSLALSFSQVSSAGKLAGGDLLQMINAGFNPLSEISKTTGKSIAELRKDMEKGAISADMVRDAMKSATGEGGKFNGMMEKQSATFSGLLSTLQDTVGQLLAEAGQPFLMLLKELMPVITPIIEGLKNFLMPLFNQLAATLKVLLPPFLSLVQNVLKAMSPILDIVVKAMAKLTPIFSKIVTAADKLVEAMQPMIDLIAELAEEQLEQLVPLLSAMLDLFIALSPMITFAAKATADLVGFGLRLVNSVVAPITDAIRYIIEKGAEAARWISKIFGGGGGGGSKPKTKQEQQKQGGGPKEGDVSADGTLIFKGGEWVPINPTAPPPGGGGGKAKDKLTPGSLPDLEAKVKALEALRDKTKAGSEEWAGYTLKIAEAQAQVDIFKRVADDLVGQGPDGKGISPFAQLAKDIALVPEAMKPAIDASVSLLDELGASFEDLAGMVGSILGSLGELFNANFEEMKYISIAEAIVNTAQGVTKAFAQGGWLGWAGATAVGLAGAAQIKRIMETRPGSTGGSGGISGAVGGSAPSGGSGMTPRRLNLSGASSTSVNVQGKLVAEAGVLTAVINGETRKAEGMGV